MVVSYKFDLESAEVAHDSRAHVEHVPSPLSASTASSLTFVVALRNPNNDHCKGDIKVCADFFLLVLLRSFANCGHSGTLTTLDPGYYIATFHDFYTYSDLTLHYGCIDFRSEFTNKRACGVTPA